MTTLRHTITIQEILEECTGLAEDLILMTKEYYGWDAPLTSSRLLQGLFDGRSCVAGIKDGNIVIGQTEFLFYYPLDGKLNEDGKYFKRLHLIVPWNYRAGIVFRIYSDYIFCLDGFLILAYDWQGQHCDQQSICFPPCYVDDLGSLVRSPADNSLWIIFSQGDKKILYNADLSQNYTIPLSSQAVAVNITTIYLATQNELILYDCKPFKQRCVMPLKEAGYSQLVVNDHYLFVYRCEDLSLKDPERWMSVHDLAGKHLVTIPIKDRFLLAHENRFFTLDNNSKLQEYTIRTLI
jgi:hypothetical protein